MAAAASGSTRLPPRDSALANGSLRKYLRHIIGGADHDDKRLLTAEDRIQLLSDWYLSYADAGSQYSFIVFSKDRPMQLFALLSSFLKSVHRRCRVIVLYRGSNDDFTAGYEKCRKLFAPVGDIAFVQQTGERSFRNDLVDIVDSLSESRLAFLVDDIVFIRDFDPAVFDAYDLRRHVPSLRLGRTIRYSYAMDKPLNVPATVASGGGLLLWTWEGNDVDWAYPLSLDGNIFLRSEMRHLLKRLSFNSPNTLEGVLQSQNDLYLRRKGIAFELPRLVNIACNRVQSDAPNRHGNLSAERLLDEWNRGFAIDIDRLRNLEADSVHVESGLELRKMDEK